MWPFRSRPALGSYGKWAARVQMVAFAWIVAIVCAALAPAAAQIATMPGEDARPLKLVAFGDSLTAGLGLPAQDAFPTRLQAALRAKGLTVDVVNAGVSGDTTADGLARLDWSVPTDTDAAIVELGANDALRGLDPKQARTNLDAILRTLAARHVVVLLAGMKAPPNMGTDYTGAFDAIFPDLAARYGLIFYPFFLDGIATDPALNLGDGLHPNAAGVEAIVARILPQAEELVARARAQRGS